MRSYTIPWTTVFVDGTSAIFIPVTGWMSSAEIEETRAAMEIAASTDTTYLQVAPAYQVAQTADAPGNSYVADTASYKKAIDVYYASAWTTATETQSNALVRFGFLAKLDAGGSGLAVGRVNGRIDIKTCT